MTKTKRSRIEIGVSDWVYALTCHPLLLCRLRNPSLVWCRKNYLMEETMSELELLNELENFKGQ
jgi:hypothetical protein